VQDAITGVIKAAQDAGKPSGIYASSIESANQYAAAGARMISVGSDIGILSSGLKGLRQALRTQFLSERL
jgi:2-dehydro-3-deoxyglucarate aldolase